MGFRVQGLGYPKKIGQAEYRFHGLGLEDPTDG